MHELTPTKINILFDKMPIHTILYYHVSYWGLKFVNIAVPTAIDI